MNLSSLPKVVSSYSISCLYDDIGQSRSHSISEMYAQHSTGREFHPSFPSTAKHIYKQLFRIFAHLYHAHFGEILHLSLEAHFNSLFAHYIAFGKEYDLLDPTDFKDLRARGGGVAALAEKWAEMKTLEL